ECSRDEVTRVRLVNLVDGDNVRMIQGGSSFCFLHKALHPIRVRRDFSGQNLQRHFAIELRILGQVHFTHSACADLRADFVTAEFCTCSMSHFFNPAVQFKIRVGGAAFVSPLSVPVRNLWPSGETSYCW